MLLRQTIRPKLSLTGQPNLFKFFLVWAPIRNIIISDNSYKPRVPARAPKLSDSSYRLCYRKFWKLVLAIEKGKRSEFIGVQFIFEFNSIRFEINQKILAISNIYPRSLALSIQLSPHPKKKPQKVLSNTSSNTCWIEV